MHNCISHKQFTLTPHKVIQFCCNNCPCIFLYSSSDTSLSDISVMILINYMLQQYTPNYSIWRLKIGYIHVLESISQCKCIPHNLLTCKQIGPTIVCPTCSSLDELALSNFFRPTKWQTDRETDGYTIFHPKWTWERGTVPTYRTQYHIKLLIGIWKHTTTKEWPCISTRL